MTDKVPEMVERVAQAIYEKMPFNDPGFGVKPKWVPGGNSDKQYEARGYARAAIEAMRIPTDQMLAIGGEEGCWDERIVSAAPSAKAALEVWQHMINEALK